MSNRGARSVGWVMAAAVLYLGCSGHASGGTGDPWSTPAADPYGTGSRITQLIGPAPWESAANVDSVNCQGMPVDHNVTLSGSTIVAIDRYDETGDGQLGNVYVQDSLLQPVPYSGIEIYNPGFSPPDLRVIEGDVVDVLGVLQEFAGPTTGPFTNCRTLPEIGGSMSFRFDGGYVPPTVIDVRDLTVYSKMRQWLGMVVTIENATLSDAPSESKGRFTVRLNVGGGVLESDIPSLSNELFDLKNSGLTFAAGDTFKSVTGVVTYFYSVHIAPRSMADIVQ